MKFQRTRLGVIAVSAALVVAGLVGCSSESSDDAASSSGDDSAFPVSLQTRLGEVQIEKKPTRVVTLGVPDLDVSRALGVTPVGAVQVSSWPWEKPLGSVEKIDYSPQGVNVEQVLALRPDVILATGLGGVDAQYDELKKIAPVVSDIDGVLTTDWRDTTKEIGQALGLASEADKLVGETEKAITDTAEQFPNIKGKTYATGAVYAPGVVSAESTSQTPMGRLFTQLGLKLDGKLDKTELDDSSDSSKVGAGTTEVSMEKLVDTIGAAQFLTLGFAEGTEQSITGSPLFQQLAAVKSGAYFGTDSLTYTALAFPTVTSIPFGLDSLKPALTKLNDGQ
ncbi:ABC transporter substrate-binding protein [Gordonia humi]|uniref:Iron complex transport system substrate-binding protein n=1 Tax=Gordonia humi TaxID=686429 RepID=A0A840EXW7_9ACTN|nr:ABC transporter substrate-binding protein [Gordonia humi]MBB4134626.1 iron complex transport system substrate-binding protein [Gordonia humi]